MMIFFFFDFFFNEPTTQPGSGTGSLVGQQDD